MKATRLSAMLLFAALAGCGDSTTAPEYDDVNGTFEGSVSGSGGGASLQGTATIVITQTHGDLSGNLTLDGTITFNGITAPMSETDEVTGTIAKGRDPGVRFTLPRNPYCPNLPQIVLAGTHNSEMRKISLTGVSPIFHPESCVRTGTLQVAVTVTKKWSGGGPAG